MLYILHRIDEVNGRVFTISDIFEFKLPDRADVRYDTFNVLIFDTITQIRSRKHRADYDTIYENISRNCASNINKEFIIERNDDLLKNSKFINKVTDREDSSESSETENCIQPNTIIVETPNGESGTTLHIKVNENKVNAQFMTLKTFKIDSVRMQSDAANYGNKIT